MGGSGSSSLYDGQASLQINGRPCMKLKKLRRSGDVIGIFVDLDEGILAFDLNGDPQGGSCVPKNQALYVMTHLDTTSDWVELRKLSPDDAPAEFRDVSTLRSMSWFHK